MSQKPQKIRARTKADGLTEADYEYYAHGSFFEAEGYEDDKTPEQLKSFWTKHRSTIMERYLARNRARKIVADRPEAFWDYDMPESQKDIAPGEYDAQKRWDHQKSEYAWVENDLEYLSRLDLLERWEKELLKDEKC
jgi:hypothetical protein